LGLAAAGGWLAGTEAELGAGEEPLEVGLKDEAFTFNLLFAEVAGDIDPEFEV